MKTFTVQVEMDHLQTLSRSKKPIIAVAELIWNGLDAEAKRVEIILERNALVTLERIRVRDNGHGIPVEDAEACFSSLGGSWKRGGQKSKYGKRMLHGRLGKGRFRSFSLGGLVKWHTCCNANGKGTARYTISGDAADPSQFTSSDPEETELSPGTEVVIDNIEKNFTSLQGENARQEITAYFALYLRQYPDVEIVYDGRKIDPATIESVVENLTLPSVTLNDGREVQPVLTVIEWSVIAEAKRKLFLCDESGFARHEIPPGVHAKGFEFTAYLKSVVIRELDEEGLLILEDLSPPLRTLVDAAKSELRSYFRKRSAEDAQRLVAQWKEDEVYPYEGEPTNPVEEAEREVFDVCALNIHTYLPEFETASTKQKHLAFRLPTSCPPNRGRFTTPTGVW